MNDRMRNVHDRLFSKLCVSPIMTLIKKRKNNMMLYWISCLNSCLHKINCWSFTILYNYSILWRTLYMMCLLVCVEAWHPSQQFFGHTRGYLLGNELVLLARIKCLAHCTTKHSAWPPICDFWTINTAISSPHHGLWHWIPLEQICHTLYLSEVIKMQFLSSRTTVLFLEF